MSRAWIVSTCCAILALLNIAGAHGHRFTDPQAESGLHDMAHGHASVSNPPSLVLADASHDHGHAKHGAVDVDPPAKMFGKTPLLKADLLAFAWAGFFFVVLRLALRHCRVAPPDRPPRHRWHPYYLPPAQAPPRTA